MHFDAGAVLEDAPDHSNAPVRPTGDGYPGAVRKIQWHRLRQRALIEICLLYLSPR